MKHGATDYLLKDRIARLGVTVEQALEKKRLREERQRVEMSLNLFRDLVDRSSDGIEVIDPETGRFLDVNETACARLGYTREELLSMSVPEVEANAVDFSSWRKMVEEIRQSNFKIIEGRHKRKDGSTFPVEVSVRYVKQDREYLIAAVRDITERKKAEEISEAQQRLLDSLISAVPDLIYFKDKESRFIRINEAYAERAGLSDINAALGKTDFDFYGEHARRAYEDEQRIIATGQPMINKEEQEDWQDGRVTWTTSTKLPLFDNNGKIAGIMGISRDITERKRAEQRLTTQSAISRRWRIPTP